MVQVVLWFVYALPIIKTRMSDLRESGLENEKALSSEQDAEDLTNQTRFHPLHKRQVDGFSQVWTVREKLLEGHRELSYYKKKHFLLSRCSTTMVLQCYCRKFATVVMESNQDNNCE